MLSFLVSLLSFGASRSPYLPDYPRFFVVPQKQPAEPDPAFDDVVAMSKRTLRIGKEWLQEDRERITHERETMEAVEEIVLEKVSPEKGKGALPEPNAGKDSAHQDK